MDPTPSIRVDRWLWAARLYRTRTLATAACNAGHVQVNGQPSKPARAVRPGDLITALTGRIWRTLRIRTVLDRRVGAKLLPQYVEDLTPPSEFEKAKSAAPVGFRPKGSGRPTKKERRMMQSYFGLDD